jgi:uncharacterized membrane protein AbrB (regulator of aidB expression)
MDWNNVAILAINALTPVVSFAGVWLLKLLWNKIPAAWMFVAAPLAGVLFNYAVSYLSGPNVNFTPIVAAIAGLGAIVLREFLTTIQTKGLSGSVSQSKSML